jgi:branched-chain amino acid transport system substrate-binding protein
LPPPPFYLRKVQKDASGKIANATIGTIFSDHPDACVGSCKMAKS